MAKKPSILFICPYPIAGAPGQRFRFEQYYDVLAEEGYEFKVRPFLSNKANSILYKPGHFIQKVTAVLFGFIKRIRDVISSVKYDFVFLHREASPVGPPIFEWLLAKVFRKKIIYDFDDAIWIPFKSETNKITNAIKYTHKVRSICKWAYKICPGNDYLANFSRQYNSNVVVLPTIVNTNEEHKTVVNHEVKPVNIGWTGSHSTLQYLDIIVPVLKKLEKEFEFTFFVISDKPPQFELDSMHFVKWNRETEVEDLMQFQIGIMPLHDNKWAEGKCGFKAIQYMALGIPALVSPVGVNSKIVDNQVNGYHCNTEDDWYKYLNELLGSVELRKELGGKARIKIVDHYSKKATTKTFLNLFS